MPRPPSAANAAQRAAANVRGTIGENVRAHRIARDLSQEELAERFGVSRAAVSQYEIGTGEVNAGDLPRLAEILGIGVLDFFRPPPVEHVPSAPCRPDFERMAAQTEWHKNNRLAPFRPLAGGGATVKGAVLETEQADAAADVMAQFAELSAEDQAVVRRVVSALHGRPPASPRRAGAKRVSRRRLQGEG